MNHRERFLAVFNYQPVDRLPVYFFGTWRETGERWRREGLAPDDFADHGPQLADMDPLWEWGMWNCHGLVQAGPLGDIPPAILEETADHIVRRNGIGAVLQVGKHGSSIAHTVKHALEPTRADWERFRRWLDPHDPRRRPADWRAQAEAFNGRDRVTPFMGGSLYGWLRDWMGVEQLSYLMCEDPVLLEEMVEYIADYCLQLHLPVLEVMRFEFVYFFEDCCFNTGPLFSPAIYRRIFDKPYRRMLAAYKSRGVPLALVDSDGNVEKLVPLWLDSGFDIVFPLEVGTWHASPAEYRTRYGRRLGLFGGVDKHVIPQGAAAIAAHLRALKPLVEEGGFLPIPDHRIPPDCSLAQFRTYVQVFKDVFNGGGGT
ncbi:MAG: hypothetical protein K8T26_05965 [Lentisphaerae bacterium]|nr:hypothetical protein [Lentisphaerota bacterium]